MTAISARPPLTYTLKHDIELTTRGADGVESCELLHMAGTVVTLRRPKAKHMRVFDGSGAIAGMLELIKLVSPLDGASVDNLDPEDFAELGNLLEVMPGAGLPTGPTA